MFTVRTGMNGMGKGEGYGAFLAHIFAIPGHLDPPLRMRGAARLGRVRVKPSPLNDQKKKKLGKTHNFPYFYIENRLCYY